MMDNDKARRIIDSYTFTTLSLLEIAQKFQVSIDEVEELLYGYFWSDYFTMYWYVT